MQARPVCGRPLSDNLSGRLFGRIPKGMLRFLTAVASATVLIQLRDFPDEHLVEGADHPGAVVLSTTPETPFRNSVISALTQNRERYPVSAVGEFDRSPELVARPYAVGFRFRLASFRYTRDKLTLGNGTGIP